MSNTEQIKRFSEIQVGDTILVTPAFGSRYALLVDSVIDEISAIGRRAKVSDLHITFDRSSKYVTAGRFNRATSVERLVR